MYIYNIIYIERKREREREIREGGQGIQTAVPYGLEGFGPLSTRWSRGFFSIFPHEMVCHGNGLPRASGAERIILLKYNVQSRLNFPINIVMVLVMVINDKCKNIFAIYLYKL